MDCVSGILIHLMLLVCRYYTVLWQSACVQGDILRGKAHVDQQILKKTMQAELIRTGQNRTELNRTEQNQSRGRVLNKCWSNGRGSLWLSLQVTAAAWGRYLETIQLVCCHRSMNIWHYLTWFDIARLAPLWLYHCTPDPEANLGHRGLAEARAGLGGICRDPEAHLSCAEEVLALLSAVCSFHPDIILIKVMQGFLQSAYSTR